jgi:hypothetical protein
VQRINFREGWRGHLWQGRFASFRWGDIAGTLNGNVRIGFVFYIDDGYLTSGEGFTFGIESWPETVTSYDLFRIETRGIGDGSPGPGE